MPCGSCSGQMEEGSDTCWMGVGLVVDAVLEGGGAGG